METITPTDGMVIRHDVRFAPGVYHLPRGVTVAADGVTLDGGGALLVGAGRLGAGVSLEGVRGVAVRNLCLAEYRHGIRAARSSGLSLAGNRVSATAEQAPNTLFLDIWLPAEGAYGGGILLDGVTESVVEENDLQHQQSGLLAYGCSGLTVRRNQANYNSGFGFYLSATSDSLFEENSADYCCRFEPREGGVHFGHMGADAAGFVVVRASCRNTFRRNTARLGGDGFFLAGLAPDGTKCGCDDNLFVENDASLSPNIAFEATFCRGNLFVRNYADRCNYGFWLGFSWDTGIDECRMVMNRQAGIAVENGHGFRVQRNTFQANGHGVLLWSVRVEAFAQSFPDHATSYGWQIEGNTFTRNGKGVRIAANQNHGIRPGPAENEERPDLRPHSHALKGNDIQDNRIGIELARADGTVIEGNILNRNVEANVRQDDAEGTVLRNNLGAAGGYL